MAADAQWRGDKVSPGDKVNPGAPRHLERVPPFSWWPSNCGLVGRRSRSYQLQVFSREVNTPEFRWNHLIFLEYWQPIQSFKKCSSKQANHVRARFSQWARWQLLQQDLSSWTWVGAPPTTLPPPQWKLEVLTTGLPEEFLLYIF